MKIMTFQTRTAARIGLGAAMAITLCSNASALASEDYGKLSDDKLLARYEKAAAAEDPEYCKTLRPMLGEMQKRAKFASKIAPVRLLNQYQCAIEENRFKDAFTLAAQLEAQTGIAQDDEVAFALALFAEEYPAAASRLIKLAGSTDGSAVGRVEMPYFWELSRQLVRNKHDEMRLRLFRAMADSPHLGRLSPNARSGVAQVTINLDAENGSFTRAKTLANELQGPYPFLELLANRKAEPIWPLLEELAGPNLQIVAEADVVAKAAAYNADRSNREAFQYYAHALHFAGKFEDAIALVQTVDHSPNGLLKATEDDLWALNIEAYALDSLGRKAEAETVFDAMATLPFEGERRSWLVNFVINRASRLVGLGQWEKGLEATMLAHEVTEQSGSPFAKMLVRKSRICALVNLGRTAEAAPLLVEAHEQREDAFASAAEAHLCAGQDDKAAAIVLEALNDPNHKFSMIDELQSDDFEIFYVRATLPSLRDRVKQRAEISAAFDAVARDLPDRLTPGASLRRRAIAAGR